MPETHRSAADERALFRYAERQRGLVTVAQLRVLGWSKQRVAAWHRRGRLQRIHRGVYAVAGSPATWEQRVLAAVFTAGAGAIASHSTALALHRVEPRHRDDSERIEVSVPAHRGSTIPGVIVHRVLLPGGDTTTVDGIPCTTYERTLVDNSASVGLGRLARGLDAGLVSNRVSLQSSRATLGRLRPAPGRRKIPLRTLLDERAPESDAAESTQEIRVLNALAAAGLPMPTPQYRVEIDGERFRFDAAYPQLRVGLEYQGWDPHRTRRAFDADYRRDRKLTLAGWTVLYFTSKSSDAEIASAVRRLHSGSSLR